MRNVLIIAGREITRLRMRFQGKMVVTVMVLLAVVAALAFMVNRQGMELAKDFYVVGVAAGAPELYDQRFHIVEVDPGEAGSLLKEGKIDIYVTDGTAFSRSDDRSQYAAGALSKYLTKYELVRISEEYYPNQAFPLRAEINYLKVNSDNLSAVSPITISDVIKQTSGTKQVAGNLPQEDIFLSGKGGGAVIPPAKIVTDDAVKQQLSGMKKDQWLPEFKAEFVSDKQIIVPSLMNPPMPLAQVLLSFFYIMPIFFICVFFTGSFMEEKVGRKLNILLSTPVTPLQIILGKMLPYLGYSLIIVILITIIFHGNIPLSLAIFLPVILFIFAIYLGVALQYRSFKDQTYFSLMAVTMITAYLIFPALFIGINNLSYISPLTLVVHMYRGESFTLFQYAISEVPMLLVFLLSMMMGSRVFNEEFLLNHRPLLVNMREAIYLSMSRKYLIPSIAVFSLLLIPVVFMVELGIILISTNLPLELAVVFMVFFAVIVEEIAKSVTTLVAIEKGMVTKWRQVLVLALVSAFFFFLGEKLFLFMSLKVISESVFTTAVFASNLLWMPLLVHCICTAVVCLITWRCHPRAYPLAVLAGALLHGLYNLSLLGVFG